MAEWQNMRFWDTFQSHLSIYLFFFFKKAITYKVSKSRTARKFIKSLSENVYKKQWDCLRSLKVNPHEITECASVKDWRVQFTERQSILWLFGVMWIYSFKQLQCSLCSELSERTAAKSILLCLLWKLPRFIFVSFFFFKQVILLSVLIKCYWD